MQYIRSREQVEEVANALRGEPLLAADTEAAGYHRYHDRVCLLQLSTRNDTYLIDTLAVDDLEPLAALFANPDVETIFHDADYDLRLLSRDFGLRVRGLFDTKIAAQLLGEKAFGLGSLLEKYLGVSVEKKYQRADWAQRPLPPELIDYAAEDTRYLPRLRDALKAQLEARGRLAWAEEEFGIEEQVRWEPLADEGEAYLRLKGTRELSPRQLAALRELYAWRETEARERDRATFRVVANEALLALARDMPATPATLARVPGVPRSITDRHGEEMLAAIERARRIPDAQLPVRPRGPGRPPPDPAFDALVERLKGARDLVADELEMDRGFLMPRAQLEEIGRAKPRTLEEMTQLPGIRRWQVEALGDRLLRAMQRR
jgi:ribonuclease D